MKYAIGFNGEGRAEVGSTCRTVPIEFPSFTTRIFEIDELIALCGQEWQAKVAFLVLDGESVRFDEQAYQQSLADNNEEG